MRPGAVLTTAGVAVLLAVNVHAAPLPPEPIVDHWSINDACKTYDFLEGSENCVFLESLGEPPYPVTRKDTRLAFRLMWGKGDRINEDITLRIEIQDNSNAQLYVYQGTRRVTLLRGETQLSPQDIADVLDVEDKSQFWKQTAARDRIIRRADGVELICPGWNELTVSGMRGSAKLVVDRWCPDDDLDGKVLLFARTLLRIAHEHFRDLGNDRDFWGEDVPQ